MDPLFLAGHPGLDFLNTAFALPADGSPVELIGDGDRWLAWLQEAGLLERAQCSRLKRSLDRDTLDAAAAEARRFRQWAREFLARWRAAPHVDYAAEVRRLNALLARASRYRELEASASGFTLVERTRIQAGSELVVLPAEQIAAVITSEVPELVKTCSGADCVLWFVDRTKAHRRTFCSAAACGNRAKVAAFRERLRKRGE